MSVSRRRRSKKKSSTPMEVSKSIEDLIADNRRRQTLWECIRQDRMTKGIEESISFYEIPEFQRTYSIQFLESVRNTSSENERVALYDVTDSRNHGRTVETIFNLYERRSSFVYRKSLFLGPDRNAYEFSNILKVFQQLSIPNGTQGHLLDKEEFATCFLRAVSYTTSQYHGYEYGQRKKISGQSEIDSNSILVETRWLRAMSWWKRIKSTLVPMCIEAHKLLTDKKSFTKQELSLYSQKRKELYEMLRDLGLLNDSIEVASLKAYVFLPEIFPDITFYSVCQEHAYKDLELNFGSNVEEDWLWTSYMRQCSKSALDLLVRVFREMIKDDMSDLGRSLEGLVIRCLEEFFSSVDHLVGAKLDDSIKSKILKVIIPFPEKIMKSKNEAGDEACNLKSALKLTSDVFIEVSRTYIRMNQKHFYQADNFISVNRVTGLVSQIRQDGMVLATYLLQNDFLTEELFLRIIETPVVSDARTTLSVKFAYCLVVCLTLLQGKDVRLFYFPKEYVRHDFMTLLDEMQWVSGSDICKVPTSSIEYSLNIRMLQEQLVQELLKDLSDLSIVAKAAKTLMYKMKYADES